MPFIDKLKAENLDLSFTVFQVRREIPKSQLLVFDVREGWEPLCSFLDVPVPEEPFPRGNDTQEMMVRLRTMKRNSVMLWSLTVLAVGGSWIFSVQEINLILYFTLHCTCTVLFHVSVRICSFQTAILQQRRPFPAIFYQYL